MGKYYPIVTAVLVAVGSIFGIEYFLNFINTALIITSLLVCDSIRPFLIGLCTYVFQVSVKNAPGYPSNSNYYLSSWRLPVSVIILTALAAALIYFTFKNKIYKRLSLRETPLLLPLVIFSAALLLNGAFSSGWSYKNLLYSLAHIAVYLVLFPLIYHGFSEDEGASDLVKYFAYITMIISFVISAEVIALYISSDNIFVDGSVNKVGVALGWGIWNLIGVSAAVLIPMNFCGMQTNKYPWLYFASATMIYLIALLSMSRNAQLFASLAYAACVLIFAFRGKHKRVMRVIAAVGAAAVLVLVILMWSKIPELLGKFFDNNGRFTHWKEALRRFASAPVFGSGFFGFDSLGEQLGVQPWMAHNTVLQILSSLGVFGIAAYIYYRAKTLMPFIKRPSLAKTMLALSVLILLLESLLDNFIFNIYPMFYAQAALAIAFRIAKEEAPSENSKELQSEAEKPVADRTKGQEQ